jgi:uncharacterized membrane protein YedE/YeeE
VCGLGRMSKRSSTAVMTFMASAILTVTLTSPSSFLSEYTKSLRTDVATPLYVGLGVKFTTTIVFLSILSYRLGRKSVAVEDKAKLFAGALAGVMFASGLAISQMVLGSNLFDFLNVASLAEGQWDPTLATVLGAAVPISAISYQFVQGFGLFQNDRALVTPLMSPKFCIPTNTIIDKHLVVGAALFGAGWGIGLLCPGPALVHAAVGNPDILFRWIPAFVAGSYTGQQIKSSARFYVRQATCEA